jgi:hypothetical protein
MKQRPSRVKAIRTSCMEIFSDARSREGDVKFLFPSRRRVPSRSRRHTVSVDRDGNRQTGSHRCPCSPVLVRRRIVGAFSSVVPGAAGFSCQPPAADSGGWALHPDVLDCRTVRAGRSGHQCLVVETRPSLRCVGTRRAVSHRQPFTVRCCAHIRPEPRSETGSVTSASAIVPACIHPHKLGSSCLRNMCRCRTAPVS